MPRKKLSPLAVRTAAFAGLVASLGAALTWLLIWTELRYGPVSVNWTVFSVIAALMLGCELLPATWIRYGALTTVTPLWMFAFGLMLLGSPAAAVSVALVGATLNAIGNSTNTTTVVTHVGSAAVSLSTAGLMLMAMDVHGSITVFDTVPWRWGLAIVLTGMSIVAANGILAAIELSLRRRVSFVSLLRRGVAARVTAEGALLSMAPLWVIGVDFSVVLIPLLGITTLLVFSSTRQALHRSHDANHDPLTGLLNRRSFLEQVGDAMSDPRAATRATMLVMDLNGFKDINDELGHQIGDTLLIAFGERLEHAVPPDAIACRLGGDEFAVLLVEGTGEGVVDTIVARLHARLTAPLDIEGFPVSVGVSIGVASAPADGRTTSDLLRAADVAMYRAKRTGAVDDRYENCVRAPQRGRLNLLGDLGAALRHHQLHINFQPQLRISDGSVDTVEALIRWTAPRARSGAPERVHRAGGTDRPDRSADRPCVASVDPDAGRPRRRHVPAGRQRVGPQSPGPTFRRQRVRDPRRVRIPARPARVGGDRASDRDQGRTQRSSRSSSSATRRPDRDRRLRGRLLVVPDVAGVEGRPRQDRPRLHPGTPDPASRSADRRRR